MALVTTLIQTNIMQNCTDRFRNITQLETWLKALFIYLLIFIFGYKLRGPLHEQTDRQTKKKELRHTEGIKLLTSVELK